MTSPILTPTPRGRWAVIQQWRERRKVRILKKAANKIALRKDLGDNAYRTPGDDYGRW